MKRFYTTLALAATMILSLAGIETKAQTVTDINVEVYGNKVIVNYTLDKTTDVDLYVSVDGGTTWEGPLKQVTGNVGKDVQPGSNVIMWDPVKERGGISGDDIRFDIRLPKIVGTITAETNNSGYERVKITKVSTVNGQCVVEFIVYEPAYAIALYYSDDNGKTWKGPAKDVEGDTQNVKVGKSQTIRWNVNEELGSLRATPMVKLSILRKSDLSKSEIEKIKAEKEQKSIQGSIYYYENGKIYRKYLVHKWFLQPEIGLGYYYEVCYNADLMIGYQFVRGFGIGIKSGIISPYYFEDPLMPITLNFRGFIGEHKTCAYYNVGGGICVSYGIWGSVSAELGLAIKNFNIGVEGFYAIHYGSVALKFSYNIPLGKK